MVTQYCESGITQREFCARRKVSVGTLQYWLRKLARDEEGRSPAAPQLVEVSLVKTELGAGRWAAGREPGATMAANAGRVYEMVLAGERRLRIPTGFDAGEVAALVALLEERGC
jgi:hypothetical protein